jgi:palmitoyltransferase ZDHHC9/14/18
MTPPASTGTNTYSHPAMVAHDDQATREHLTSTAADNVDHHEAGTLHYNTSGNRSSTGSRVLGMTGPLGEPGLPPSRPSSIATAQSGQGNQKRWSQTARGGVPGVFGPASAAGSMGHQSRPTTAASRTHVPLAAHGFFRPMSSQRLQQQRNQRPMSLLGHSSLYSEGTNDSGDNPYRQSSGSNNTIRNAPAPGLHHDADHPPASRGTDITDRDMPDRTTANTTPTGAETVRSRGESITPLQRPRPQHLDLSQAHNDNGKLPTPGKSPRSYKSSFVLPSRDGRSTQMRPHQGHEKLASAASSPRMNRKEEAKEEVKKELGKNHQYFSGNTVFCWGGRFQNTRDRPVNIATGLAFVLPSCLFFGFS